MNLWGGVATKLFGEKIITVKPGQVHPQDSIHELIIWKMNAVVVPIVSVKFKSAFLHA